MVRGGVFVFINKDNTTNERNLWTIISGVFQGWILQSVMFIIVLGNLDIENAP